MSANPYSRNDFDHSPMIVFYEMTRACDLACVHCRADAQHGCDPNELSPDLARRLVDQLLQFPKPPLLVLTGGDPLKRADVFDLVEYARAKALNVAMTPSATPLVTRAAIERLRDAGLHRLAVSLDGASAATHDAFRKVAGSYQRTLGIIADAHELGLPMQINTTIGRHNLHELDAMLDLVTGLKAILWSVFFIVPTGRATAGLRLSAEECEDVFARLHQHTQSHRIPIKTTEAPHYRRFVLQQAKKDFMPLRRMPLGQIGTNDGKGILFISHTGEIYPSGFLPIECGRFPFDSLVRVYQQSKLFRALRDGDRLNGKCGACEYRNICGGSRARSYALTGDPLASEPDCIFVPEGFSKESNHAQHHEPVV
jgi:radical SAM protein with 4Fe4S-binding SPASM domain